MVPRVKVSTAIHSGPKYNAAHLWNCNVGKSEGRTLDIDFVNESAALAELQICFKDMFPSFIFLEMNFILIRKCLDLPFICSLFAKFMAGMLS